MPTTKYSNGAYKTTSKSQEQTARNLFIAGQSMGRDFNQLTGNLKVTIYFTSGQEYSYNIDRLGRIVK